MLKLDKSEKDKWQKQENIFYFTAKKLISRIYKIS